MTATGALRGLSLSLALLTLAACSPRGAELEIIPARTACPPPKVVAVRWRLPADEPLPAQLTINGPGKPTKPWRKASTHEGEANTGSWAGDGLTVTLVSKAGKPLARRTLTREPCAKR
ncbi:hypothetical protein [Luteimonas arsenica]|uniref:hypothetical protein n=1 Tax=Luteimonas arsenica TaxID=1586242 RepID=UPI001055180A|nr:hypothetical protein [Luteimonas arsenica]